MFEEVGYEYDQVYEFLMDVAYLTFWNSIDVFNGAQKPLVINTEEHAWPDERNRDSVEVDV